MIDHARAVRAWFAGGPLPDAVLVKIVEHDVLSWKVASALAWRFRRTIQ